MHMYFSKNHRLEYIYIYVNCKHIYIYLYTRVNLSSSIQGYNEARHAKLHLPTTPSVMSRRILDLWPWPLCPIGILGVRSTPQKNCQGKPARNKAIIKGWLRDQMAVNNPLIRPRPYFLGKRLLGVGWTPLDSTAWQVGGDFDRFDSLRKPPKKVGTFLWEFNGIHGFLWRQNKCDWNKIQRLWYLIHRFHQKFEWDLTNGPLSCDRAIRYSGFFGVRSVGPVGNFLDRYIQKFVHWIQQEIKAIIKGWLKL